MQLFSKEKYLEFLYANANTGQSSGGHTGIKFEDIVYHFQFHSDEIFHLERDTWNEFYTEYSQVDNRSIQIAKILVAEEDFEKLKNGFNKIYLSREKQIYNLNLLMQDKMILESIEKQSYFLLSSAGLFSEKEKNCSLYKNFSSDLISFYNEKIKINKELERFNFFKNTQNFAIFKDKFPEEIPNFSSSLIQLLYKKEFLENLLTCSNFRKDSYFIYSKYSLTESDRESLVKYKNNLINEFFNTWNSNFFQEEEFKIFIKILLIENILIENKLIFLTDKESWKKLNYLSEDKFLIIFQEKLFTEFNRILKTSNIEFSEKYNLLEKIVLLKESYKPKEIYLKYILKNNELENTTEFLNTYHQKLKQLYPFDLIKENCTTEIFRSILNIFPEKESTSKLGGIIKPNQSLHFIPFFAYNKVSKIFNTTEKVKVNSIKENLLLNKKGIEYFYENITFTSSIYKFNQEDGFFIFFTDSDFYTRPIFGFFNFTAASIAIIYSIAYIPIDGGKKFILSTQAALFSLPELVFFNIRKGSFYYTQLIRKKTE